MCVSNNQNKKDEALIVDLNNLLDNSSKKDRNSQNGESD